MAVDALNITSEDVEGDGKCYAEIITGDIKVNQALIGSSNDSRSPTTITILLNIFVGSTGRFSGSSSWDHKMWRLMGALNSATDQMR